MVPVSFDGCFGWLHSSTSLGKNTAVVLCSGLKSDHLAGYRSLRLLADALAEKGFPTLRLDYPGTGNSYDPAVADYWTTWQHSIHRAADWLRHTCPVDRIVLVGLRFGAILATVVAADRTDVAGLVLLAPVRRGRSYIRQLIMEGGPAVDGSIDAGRVQLSTDTVQAINRIELRRVALPPGLKVALFSPGLAAADCGSIWARAGLDVASWDFTGLEPMLRPTFTNHEPPAAIEPIVRWLNSGFPKHASAAPTIILPEAAITSGYYTEEPVFFGPNRSLFGILCCAHDQQSPVVVMMGNSSGDPHCSNASVDLARHLATGGVTSLRFDFHGVGESASSNQIGTHVFEVDRRPDFAAALDALADLGYRQFATYGLCSGAYHAYHGAMADPRVTYSFLVNLPFFQWVEGFPVEDLVLDKRQPMRVIGRLPTQSFWSYVVFKLTQREFRLRERFDHLWNRFCRPPSFIRDTAQVTNRPSHPVNMLFLVSEDDVSIDVLERTFGGATLPGTTIELVSGLNHSMTETICDAWSRSVYLGFWESR